MKNSLLIIVPLCIILAISACSGSTTATQAMPTQEPGQSTSTAQSDGYPAPLNNNDEYPYPYPESSSPVVVNPQPTYTTDPLMGSVSGSLLENNKGIENITLYLAEVLKDKSGRDIVAGLDRMKAPTTDTSTNGKFTFINVNPGRYALILDVVTNQYMMNYPNEDTPIIIEVSTGEQVDLGDLNYDSLPIP